MAEGALRVLLEKERPGRFEVDSAGTAAATGFPATVYAVEAAKIWDADISSHRSQPLTEKLVDEADLILAMTPAHHAEIVRVNRRVGSKTFLLENYPDPSPEGEGIEDPIGQPLEKYNEVFIEIGEYLGKHLPAIVKTIDERTSDG
jgi:protein-tyrosine phosphatase